MKKVILFALLFHTLVANSQQISQGKGKVFYLPAGVRTKDYVPGAIIVKFKAQAETLNSVKKAGRAPVLRVSSAEILSVQQKFPQQKTSSEYTIKKQADEDGLSRIYEVKFKGTSGIEKVINEILKDQTVEYAEPKYVCHIEYAPDRYVPDDPYYTDNEQGYLDQVQAPEAWAAVINASGQVNSSGVLIGIVDSGSDLDHEDLAANIYVNTADPVDGVDNDGDGYVDNFRGWDLVGASGTEPKEDSDPGVKSDAADHGAHVSGIASAVSDNGIGVASIASNAKLLIVKAAADDDATTIYAGYEGIKYAVDHGANIINCSWGGPAGGDFGKDIVNYALSRGCMIVAAAGNENTSDPDYPAAYPGVFAVANVGSSDTKNFSSNYGTYVSVSAPGTNILNTGYNNSYKVYSGTSMSTPLVSSAAALVKARFPELTMEEVAQKLRVTADNIDDKNPLYAGQLGSGRLNVYRALSESLPSVRNQKLTVTDKNNGSYLPGDTLKLYFDLKNFLNAAGNAEVSLTAANSNLVVLTGPIDIGTLNTEEVKTGVGPFKVYIKPEINDNTNVVFRINYTANGGAYNDSETFSLIIAKDYLNYQVNQIATTATSNGRVGYSAQNSSDGQGFIYKNQQLLYEASLMIGNSSTVVSNNARSSDNSSSEHFIKKDRVRVINNADSAFEIFSEFDDSGNPRKLNIDVKHRQIAFTDTVDSKYVIAEYRVINRNSYAINNLYIGLFTDWDIDDGSDNATRFDAVNSMAYTWSKKDSSLYAGVKLLSDNARPAYYPLSYFITGDPLEDGVFSISEKFQTLSSGIKASGLGENTSAGYDVMYTTGLGPFDIPANDSVKVAFAFIAGENLSDLQESAIAAQQKYKVIAAENLPLSANVEITNFPNPTTQRTTVQFSLPQNGMLSLAVYNLAGQKVKTLIDHKQYDRGVFQVTLDMSGLQDGIYICRLQFNNQVKSRKVALFR